MSDVERFEPEEDEDAPSPWGWFFAAGVAVLIAVLCFTPIWEEATDGGGRRGWIGDLLRSIGQVPIAIVCAAFAAFAVIFAIRILQRGQD